MPNNIFALLKLALTFLIKTRLKGAPGAEKDPNKADDLHWKSSKNYTLQHAAERIKIYSKEQFKFNIVEIPLP